MTGRRTSGARPDGSVRGYIHQSRISAGVSVLVLAAAVTAGGLANGFWVRNPLLTNLLASLVVVVLSVAVINAVIEHRRRRRWSALAQYVLFELVRTARVTWTTLLELLGPMRNGEENEATLTAGARALRDTPCIVAAVRELLGDPDRRQQL